MTLSNERRDLIRQIIWWVKDRSPEENEIEVVDQWLTELVLTTPMEDSSFGRASGLRSWTSTLGKVVRS